MVFVEAFTLNDYIQLEKNGYNPMLTRDGNIKGLIWLLIRNLVYGNKVSRIATCPVNDLFCVYIKIWMLKLRCLPSMMRAIIIVILGNM